MKKEKYSFPEVSVICMQMDRDLLSGSDLVKGDNIDQWVEGETDWL